MEKLEQFKNIYKKVRQESSIIGQGGVRINDALWYHISKEYPDEIGIHLFALDLNQTHKGSMGAMDLYKRGLSELALRIQTDPELAGISQVVGWSKLVYEHPRLLRSLGFQVTEKNEDKKEALAVMSREDFLERYGSQT